MTEADPNQAHIASVMEDPSALAVAQVYAVAFLNATGDDADDSIEELTSFVDDVLARNPEFESILFISIVPRSWR